MPATVRSSAGTLLPGTGQQLSRKDFPHRGLGRTRDTPMPSYPMRAPLPPVCSRPPRSRPPRTVPRRSAAVRTLHRVARVGRGHDKQVPVGPTDCDDLGIRDQDLHRAEPGQPVATAVKKTTEARELHFRHLERPIGEERVTDKETHVGGPGVVGTRQRRQRGQEGALTIRRPPREQRLVSLTAGRTARDGQSSQGKRRTTARDRRSGHGGRLRRPEGTGVLDLAVLPARDLPRGTSPLPSGARNMEDITYLPFAARSSSNSGPTVIPGRPDGAVFPLRPRNAVRISDLRRSLRPTSMPPHMWSRCLAPVPEGT